MKTLTMFGLDHCSTCKAARADLAAAGWTVAFRDVARQPLSADERAQLVAGFSAKVVNRASLTWRAMNEAERAADLVQMLADRPSVMKRPAIVVPGTDGGADRFLQGWTANVKRALDVPAR